MDLNALSPSATIPCYNTFLAETRSSNSETSTLSDFALGNINTCLPNLSITKTADAPTINAGDTAGFTITVSNTGDGTARAVSVNDPLPAGVDWTTSTPGAVISGGMLTANIGTLAPSASAVIHVSGVITSSSVGTLTDTATVSASNQEASSSATASVSVCTPVVVERLVRKGYHHHLTRIILTFSGALDPATASNIANYQLAWLHPHGHPGARRLRLRRAIYDPVHHTVTLRPRRRLNLHDRYRLRISGVESACGDPIVGNGGPGGSFVVKYGVRSFLGGIVFHYGPNAALPRPSAFRFRR